MKIVTISAFRVGISPKNAQVRFIKCNNNSQSIILVLFKSNTGSVHSQLATEISTDILTIFFSKIKTTRNLHVQIGRDKFCHITQNIPDPTVPTIFDFYHLGARKPSDHLLEVYLKFVYFCKTKVIRCQLRIETIELDKIYFKNTIRTFRM